MIEKVLGPDSTSKNGNDTTSNFGGEGDTKSKASLSEGISKGSESMFGWSQDEGEAVDPLESLMKEAVKDQADYDEDRDDEEEFEDDDT